MESIRVRTAKDSLPTRVARSAGRGGTDEPDALLKLASVGDSRPEGASDDNGLHLLVV
jgi:hypothetical protein